MVRTKEEEDRCLRRELLAAVGGVAVTGAAGCVASGRDPDRKGSGSGNVNDDEKPETEKPAVRGVELGPDTFERLSAFEVVNGSLSAYTERHVTGTQCAALETGGNGAWLHAPLDEPMDFINARPACYVATDGPAAGKYLYLDLSDEDGNRFRTRTVVRGREQLIRADFGIVDPQVDDEPVDLENVTRLSFRPSPRNKSGDETVYLDHPSRIVAPDTAKVVFQFDDGSESDHTHALPYLSQFDYPAITYVNTDDIGNDGKLTEEQLQELKSAGWLVGSHTTDHTNLSEVTDPAEIEAKVKDAKQWLVDRGFTEGARHFSYPYGGVDEQALSIVSQFHDTGRVGGWQPVALPSNPQLISGSGELTLSDMQRSLDLAVRYGGVVVVFYHNLEAKKKFEEFRAVVDEVHRRDRAGDVEVVRLDELHSMAEDLTY
jgi:peptidoglycan/xylan/chitin deacetylase (PgdA/CDA1 family)